ncbi:MAG: hypothetical protein ACXADB_09140 [Candidatus Hermodarchaeia archaeon]
MSKNTKQPHYLCVFPILALLILVPVVSQLDLPLSNLALQVGHQSRHYFPLQLNLGNLDMSQTWNRTYSRSTYDRGYGVVKCQDGGFAIIGETRQEGVEFRSDVWLLRVDESGNLLW